MIKNANDMMLKGYCPEAGRVKNPYRLFKESLISFDIMDNESNDIAFLISIITYRVIEEFLKDVYVSVKKLETIYNYMVSENDIVKNISNRDRANGWIRFLSIYKKLIDLIETHEHITTNVEFSKTLRNDRYDLKIDILLISENKHTLIIIAPYIPMSLGLSIMSNIGVFIQLEYLNDAEFFPDEIIELSYSTKVIEKRIFVKNVFTKDLKITEHINSFKKRYKETDINLMQCRTCPIKNRCFPKCV